MQQSRRRKSLVLTLTHNCNLSCVYCYEKNKSKRYMSLDTAKVAVSRHLSDASQGDEVELSFHGGEPFLAFGVLRDLCEWIWEQAWPLPYIIFVTTNGTLVHGEIQEWVASNKSRLYLGLSLDGTREMHNLNRSGSFDQIDVDFFLHNWPDQPVKMTISDLSLPLLAEGMIHLHEKGFLIQSNFSFGTDWSAEQNIAELTKQLDMLIEFYLKNPRYTPCEFLSMPIDLLGSSINSPTKWCGVGTDMVATDVDGKEYPCHLFLPMASGRNLLDRTSIDWNNHASLQDSNCRDCVIYRICPTCYGVNLIQKNDPATRDPNLCSLTKVRALACSYFQAHLLARNITAAPMTQEQASLTFQKLHAIEAIQTKITF